MSIHLSRLPAQLAVPDLVAPPSTLVELLLWRASGRPDQLAYTFLSDGETNTDLITYGELDRRARTIGALLQQAGAAGERALLLYPPGIEYIAAFFGCLYAGVTAVPAYPPNPSKIQRTLPRLQTIVNDARPMVALTTAEILPMAEAMAMIAPDFQRMRWLATDAPVADIAPWEAPELTGQTLAMLQYTSGSTSTPKGVMLSHSNLLHNLGLIHSCFGHDSSSAGVIWLPPYHDMGLIGGILQPLYGAFPVTLMSPVAFLQRPLRWLEAITRARATTSGGPNFAYDLCVRKITPEQRATLDLSSWRVAFNGAEPIQPETMNRFVEAFGPCGFRRDAFLPCYGLAEATLIVSGKGHDARPIERLFQGAALEQNQALTTDGADPAGRRLVGCGPAMADLQIAIVQPETQIRCAPGDIGEIWVSGPSIAQGYWDQPEVSQQTFGARPAGEAAGPFLRTGDLGFMQDGELFVTGRIKDLLIIRGRNHYPHDIELTIERSHPAMRPGCGAAFTVEIDGEERLVIAQEIERQYRTVDVDEVAAAVRRAVAEQHELHVYAITLLKTGAIPKTSSGKIQRRATRAEYLEGTLSLVGSSLLEEATPDTTEQPTREDLLAAAPEARGALLEAYVRAEIAQVLRVAPAAIDPGQPLSDLGLDSLMAVDLQHRLESGLGIVVPMTSFLEGVSIAQLAEGALAQLAAATDSPQPSIALATAAGQAEHPLSYGQRAMWFLHQLAPESAAYNIAGAVRIASALDTPALRRAFQHLVDRHPVLRTTFPLRAGEPVQSVQPPGELLFVTEQATGWSEAELNEHLTEAAHQPFDLELGPLLRVHLFARAAEEHILLLVMHHIISDLWSLAILVQELGRLYPAEQAGAPLALDPLPIQYTGYARRQAERLAGPQGQRDWAYWQDMLSGELPVLNLPTDRPRPPIQTYHGASQAIQFGPELTSALKARGQERRATLYMVLVAAFHALLYRYTGQDDLIVGSTTAGRQQAELAGVAGYFVNPIALRAKFPAGITFEALLDQVRRTVLGALEHADYPLALAIERLQPVRDLSRSPLFQAMFILQKAPTLGEGGLEALALGAQGQRVDLAGLRLESLTLDHRISQFDLTLTLGEAGGRLIGTFEYNTDLFDATTVARWTGHFEQLLTGIAAEPRRPIAQVPLLTIAEQRQFVTWNATNAAGPQVESLVALFERQVEQTPEATAVLLPEAAERGDTGRSLTYRELNQRANQLARHLRKLGVGPEVCAGLCLDRSLELVVAILGVLKAGGAYLPLDPDYPAERMAFMLREARASVLITTIDLRDKVTRRQGDKVTESEDAITVSPLHPVTMSGPEVVDLVADWPEIAREPDTNQASGVHPENLACVIYTSGSTGQPKGVLLEHRNLVNLVCSFIESYAPGETDRLLPLTAIASASFVGEVLPVLCSGGALVLPDKGEFLDFQQLIALIAREGVSILSTVPAFLSGINALAGQLPRLRLMLSGGEALFANQVDQLLDSATVVNGYGLTETTVCSTCYQVGPDDLRSDVPIPIGPPLRNTRIAVLDQHGQPAPIGMPGELYIAGAGVVRGYLNDPALTAERFVPFSTTTDDRRPTTDSRDKVTRRQGDKVTESEDAITMSPLHPVTVSDKSVVGGQWSVAGGRLYRTGDLARWLPHGGLEYLGRIDQQVKIRGFRIELGEIETRLGQHPAVREAVVLARDLEGQHEKRLIAYVVPRQEQRTTQRVPDKEQRDSQEPRTEDGGSKIEDGAAFAPTQPSSILHPPSSTQESLSTAHESLSSNQYPLSSELRAFLQDRLPDYMLPAAFVFLPALPLTPNGKVDTRALPIPDSARPALAAAYVAPQSEAERTIVAVWQETLGVDKVGVHDNFFELGGHSLLLVKAHSKLREAFDRPLSLVDMFKYPTVSALAQYLNQEPAAAPSFDKLQAVAEKQRQARGKRQQLMKDSRASRRKDG